MALRDFDAGATDIMREAVRRFKQSHVRSNPRAPDEQTPPAPPFYLARVARGTGEIPAITLTEPFTPGTLVCDIYRIDANGLPEALNITRKIYNVSSQDVTAEWIPVLQLKNGLWVASRCVPCTPPVCDCTCVNCQGNEAQCCFIVQLFGMTDGTCSVCEQHNRFFWLNYINLETGTGSPTSEGCVWVDQNICSGCGDFTEAKFEILAPGLEATGTGTGAGYRYRFTFGEVGAATEDLYVWETDLGDEKPDCCPIEVTLPLIHEPDGRCDATGSTLTVTGGDICAPPCPITCNNCISCITAACWQVTLSGFVNDTGSPGCVDCNQLNKTYNLAVVPGGVTGTGTGSLADESCVFQTDNICGECTPSPLTLEILFRDPDYISRVTFGAITWEKNWGATVPGCCGQVPTVELDLVDNDEDCDATDVVCEIAAHNVSLANCLNTGCTVECSNLDPPEVFTVDLGIGGWTDVHLDECDEVLGEYDVPFIGIFSGDCIWELVIDPWALQTGCFFEGQPFNLCMNLDIHLTLDFPTPTSAQWVLEVMIGDCGFHGGSVSKAVYFSAIWDPTIPGQGDWDFLADANGKIALTGGTVHHLARCLQDPPPPEPVCAGDLPATVHIFAAVS